MAKRRMLSQNIIYDEVFNSLSLESQNLFYRMLVISDDCGVVPGNDYTLKKMLNLPEKIYSNLQEFLKELETSHLILRFEHEQKPFYCFKKQAFDEYQAYIIKNRTKSEYTKLKIDDYDTLYSKLQENKVISKDISDNESYHIESKEIKVDSNKLKDKEQIFDFEKVWNLYPRKEGKKEAIKHFTASVKTETDYNNLITAIDNYKNKLKADKTESKYIKMGNTFFNNWQDYINLEIPNQRRNKIQSYEPKPEQTY